VIVLTLRLYLLVAVLLIGDDEMRLPRVVAAISAICLMTGLVVYGGIFLWPRLAGSAPADRSPAREVNKNLPRYLYSIGSDAGLDRPNTVTVDAKGRVFVTDAGSARVYVFSAEGKKISEFGGSGERPENLAFPNGIVINRQGNLVIADSVKRNLKIFSPEGGYLKTIQSLPKDTKPGFLSIGPDDLIYISDLSGNRVLAMDAEEKIIRTIAVPEKPLSYPQGTAVDNQGQLWVADSGNYQVRILDSVGQESGLIKGGGPEDSFSMVRGIVLDPKGRAYVSDTISRSIKVFKPSGELLYSFPESSGGAEGLVFPTALAVYGQDRLFVVDRGANDIKVYSLTQN